MRQTVALLSLLAAGLALGSASAQAANALPGRELRATDLPGYAPSGVETMRTPARWSAFASRPLATISADGFVVGVRESLRRLGGSGEGLSLVAEFGSPTAARHEVSLYRTQYPAMASFPVATIPGAYGFADDGGENIAFSFGRYQYLVGAGWPQGDTRHASKNQLVRAAATLYARAEKGTQQ